MEESESLFVGIDPSFSGTGLIVLTDKSEVICEKVISANKIKDNPYEIEERMISIVDNISSSLEPYKNDIKLVYLEAISYSSKGQKIAEMAALNYQIRLFLYQNNYTYKAIPPTVLKKFVTGTGRCQKNLMLLKCFKKFGIEFDDDNICDAYLLGRMALDNYKNLKK